MKSKKNVLYAQENDIN